MGSTGYNFYHDAFEATTDLSSVSDNATDGSTAVRWNKQTHAAFYNGTQSSNDAIGAACAFTFEGSSVDFFYGKSAVGGVARVRIDGVDQGTVDMFAASPVFQSSRTFSGLGPGLHTILITNDKTSTGGGYYLYVDAFRVGGVVYDDTP